MQNYRLNRPATQQDLEIINQRAKEVNLKVYKRFSTPSDKYIFPILYLYMDDYGLTRCTIKYYPCIELDFIHFLVKIDELAKL